MRTCLDELWNFIINDVAELIDCKDDDRIKSIASDLVLKIESFFDFDNYYVGEEVKKLFGVDLKYVPTHIVAFKQGLMNLINDVECGNAIDVNFILDTASNETNDCGLCSFCNGCSKKFYGKSVYAYRNIPDKLKMYSTSRPSMYYYEKEASVNDMTVDEKDCLMCLKGLSSSSPMVRTAVFDTTCKGGGFYLNLGGFGIVIDPGVGFVDQFHKYGLYIDDINSVLISHNHLDHYADSLLITSLRHDYKAYINNRYSLFDELFKYEKNSSEDGNDFVWIVDELSKETLSNLTENDKVVCFSDCVESPYNINDGRIRVVSLKTEHSDAISTYAMKIETEGLSIGYTSDTKYNEELLDFFKECDLLIMNISDIYEKDVTGEKQKRGHLGFNGCYELINVLGAKAFIVSEFNCSNGDIRYEVVHELAKKTNKRVIPAEVGMVIRFEDNKNIMFRCSHCGNDNNIDDMLVISPEKQFNKIKYLCSNCYSTIEEK